VREQKRNGVRKEASQKAPSWMWRFEGAHLVDAVGPLEKVRFGLWNEVLPAVRSGEVHPDDLVQRGALVRLV
jgi:hypothetical protein